MTIEQQLAEYRAALGEGSPIADTIMQGLITVALQGLNDRERLQARELHADMAKSLAALPDNATRADLMDAVKAVLGKAEVDAEDALAAFRLDSDLPSDGLAANEPAPREWIVPKMLPANRLASLYGEGAAGKSLLGLQLAASIMQGKPALNGAFSQVPCERGRVLWLTWEDELDEISRRWFMLERAGVGIAPGLDKRNLTLVDMRAVGGPLWAPEGKYSGHIASRATWTPAGLQFLRMMQDHRLAVLDPIAAAFASSENDRSLVRQFCAALDGASEQARCTTLLIGHPPKSDARYSGSTDWRNAVRSMWVLEQQETGCFLDTSGKLHDGRQQAKADGGEATPVKAWQLRNDKASYGPEVRARWMHRHWKGWPNVDASNAELGWHWAVDAGEAARLATELAEVHKSDQLGDNPHA